MRVSVAITALGICFATAALRGQAPSTSQETVTREEYDKLKREQDSMRQEIDELKRALKQQGQTTAPVPAPQAAPSKAAAPAEPNPHAPTAEDFEDVQKQLKDVKDQLDAARPGSASLVIAGDMDVG